MEDARAQAEHAKHEVVNMRGKKQELVLAGKECVRVFWMPVLARGKLHIELLGSGFAGDHVNGMLAFVQKLKASLNTRFRNDQPKTVFVDLGGGFYQGGKSHANSRRPYNCMGLKLFMATTQACNQDSREIYGCTKQQCHGCDIG